MLVPTIAKGVNDNQIENMRHFIYDNKINSTAIASAKFIPF